MTTRTHWKQLVNPDYIGAYALPDGDDLTVTIDYVQREMITVAGGKKEECTVAHLVGNKPFILNATNSKSIHKLYGPYIEDWRGKQITLYASTTKLGTDTVECLRIRPQVPRATKKPLPANRFDKALAAVAAGEFAADKLRADYALTAEQEAALAALAA